jgi:sugar O-acyltransferase (sialic acid O-acetyltransferase NeuD family)
MMVRDLFLSGLDVHNGEMAEIVERINAIVPTWNLLGFLSPDGSRVGTRWCGYPIFHRDAVWNEHPQALVVPSHSPSLRIPHLPRERYATLIDPSAWVSRTAKLGVGCAIYPHCFIGLNTVIGDFCFCLSGSIINHDNIVEEGVTIASGSCLAGNVHVEAGCYLGQACTVRQHVRIGRHSLIGTGAVVLRDVPDDSVMVGNPARRLRANSQQSRQ